MTALGGTQSFGETFALSLSLSLSLSRGLPLCTSRATLGAHLSMAMVGAISNCAKSPLFIILG